MLVSVRRLSNPLVRAVCRGQQRFQSGKFGLDCVHPTIGLNEDQVYVVFAFCFGCATCAISIDVWCMDKNVAYANLLCLYPTTPKHPTIVHTRSYTHRHRSTSWRVISRTKRCFHTRKSGMRPPRSLSKPSKSSPTWASQVCVLHVQGSVSYSYLCISILLNLTVYFVWCAHTLTKC